jgi:hypothetical protein
MKTCSKRPSSSRRRVVMKNECFGGSPAMKRLLASG